jgi:hypothetical protein
MPDIGNDVDDGAAIGLHPAVVDFAHEDETAGQVAADHGLEPLGRDGLHWSAILAAGIVHEPIDTAIGAKHGVDGGDHHRFVPDIANLGEDLPAVLFDLDLHFGELLGGAAKDRDIGAKRREFVRGAATDAAAAAGDDNRLTSEQLRPEDRLIRHLAGVRYLRPPNASATSLSLNF